MSPLLMLWTALHRHATEEVFIPVKGRWQVFWLEGDEERTLNLEEGDVVNVPIGIYRGFRSLTDAPDALLRDIELLVDAGDIAALSLRETKTGKNLAIRGRKNAFD